MSGIIILLLSLCLLVGLFILLIVLMHFHQWKQANKASHSPKEAGADIHSYTQAATKPLSSIEKKYLALFIEGKTTEEISAAMHVEPSSVYTMKYRIRKKFPTDYNLPF